MTRKRFLYDLLCLCALWLMTGCISTNDDARMRQQLETLEQQDRNSLRIMNDSLAESLAAFFDRHGSANERLRAKYILGRTYYCLGELPRALEVYNEAADCADTTQADCDFRVFARIHAGSARVFHKQLQLRSELKELRLAEYYAKKGGDTLSAIDYYALQAGAYGLLHLDDSVVLIKERAAQMLSEKNKPKQATLILGTIIASLVTKGELDKAEKYIRLFEGQSGLFDEAGDIRKGYEIFYYEKGQYYLASHKTDSAEYMFRKELRKAKDLNNQIAGSKGLQAVYEQKRIPDSVAKYASLGYELNDSAYSLSEMQNIQMFQASYNYNHHKLQAKQSEKMAQRSLLVLIVVIAIVVILSLIASFLFLSYRKERELKILQYQKDLMTLEKLQAELQDICSDENLSSSEIFEKKSGEIVAILNRVSEYKRKVRQPQATMEDLLANAPVVRRLKEYVSTNPYQKASQRDFTELKSLINEEIPHFYTTLNTSNYTLSAIEYDVSLLLRVHFSPMDIHKLTGLSPSYVSNMRSRLLLRIFGIDGSPVDYDKRILAIS